MTNYVKVIVQAIKNENQKRLLAPKCWRCGSKKNLYMVCAPGTYYECKSCKDLLNRI